MEVALLGTRLDAPDLLAEEEREAVGAPSASRSATRVSARSTLTRTCFFNLIQSFDGGWARAAGRVPDAPAQRGAFSRYARGRAVSGLRLSWLARAVLCRADARLGMRSIDGCPSGRIDPVLGWGVLA